MTTENISLESGDWRLLVAPQHGGCILECTYQGQDVLRPAPQTWYTQPDPVLTSCFPLIPFSNRIGHGRFDYRGRTVSLPPTHKSETHPIHGYGWISEWECLQQTDTHIDLQFEYDEKDWPWSFTGSHSFQIIDDTLRLSLSLTNTSNIFMPAGLGFHPYFPHAKSARLSFSATGYWESDDENLPKKWVALSPKADFTSGLPVSGLNYDNCFTGWNNRARVFWPERGMTINIRASENLGFAVLYTPVMSDYFCFEPVSHLNNAVNLRGTSAVTGCIDLAPLDTMSAHIDFIAQLNPVLDTT